MSDAALRELDAATQAAVGWLVVLHSGETSAAEQRDFDLWLTQSAEHRAAWQRLAGALDDTLAPARHAGSAHAAPGAALGQVLAHAESRTRQRRHLLRGALALSGVATAAALLAERQWPLAHLAADLRTGTGERRDFALPDGSRLSLDARSAVDLDFSVDRRTVTLRRGALVAQAAPLHRSGIPFVVRTAHGAVRALGTRFVVRQEALYSTVGMLEHSVEITAPGAAPHTLTEGQSARFGPDGIFPLETAPSAASAWQRGMLEAHDQPLGEVLQALRAYRAGFIRIAPKAAALRVYGSYALDDTDLALAALAETLPVSVRIYQGGWLVVIE